MTHRSDRELIAAARKRSEAIRRSLKSRGGRDGAPELLDALANRLEALLEQTREDADPRALERADRSD